MFPAIKEMDGAIVRGEKHRERGAAYSAEFEYKQAMAIDEENVRANFGLGLTYLDRGDQVKANDIFERLVDLEAAFEEEHKHLFNDFGINMRKNKMYEQALQYYLRAEGLVANDEHLFHNIARCYYEKGDVDGCKKYLLKSLQVNPNLKESIQFWAFLKTQGHVSEGEGPDTSIESQTEPDTSVREKPVEADVPGYAPIKHEDFVYALSHIDTFVDITEEDLLAIYELATRRHVESSVTPKNLF